MKTLTLVGCLAMPVSLVGCFADPSPDSTTDVQADDADDETDETDDSTGDELGSDLPDSSDTGLPPAPLPVLAYTFDGTLQPSIGATAAVPIGAVGFAESPHGQAVVLQGGAHLDVSEYADDFVSLLDSMTVAIRYRWSSDETTPQSLVALGTNGSSVEDNDFRIQIGQNLTVVTQTGPGNEHVNPLAPPPPTNEWVNLVLTFDDGVVAVYVNGLHLVTDLYVPAETEASVLLAGSNACCGHAFDGQVDNLAFYDVPLALEQAIELSMP